MGKEGEQQKEEQERLEEEGKWIKQILTRVAAVIPEEFWPTDYTQDNTKCIPLFPDRWFEEGEKLAVFPDGSIKLGMARYVPPYAHETDDGFSYGDWEEIPIEDYILHNADSKRALEVLGDFLPETLFKVLSKEFPSNMSKEVDEYPEY